MKSTGIVRKIDDLGRVVLPIELRRVMGLQEGSSVEIAVENGRVILSKYEPTCVFCGSSQDIVDFKGKIICADCVKALKV